ncbi:ester cyclase [Gemmatimonadota bacterium]
MADNQTIGRRFFEEMLGEGNWELAKELTIDEVVMHHPASPTPVEGRESVVGMLAAFRGGFPDLNMAVEDVFGEGDMVAVRWRARGTHTAELFGIPASGKSMNVGGISLLRIENGKVVEDWVAEDSLGLMKQIGVIPE